MHFFDTHTHLQVAEFAGDLSGVLARARAAGVDGMLVLGVDAVTSQRALELARQHPDVFAAAGCHPHDAKDLTDDAWQALEQLALDPPVAAIGEIGLDFYRDLSPRDTQVSVLERQLGLASRARKPVAVHCREAHETMYPLLRAWAMASGLPGDRPLGVMHYFSGDVELAYRYVELGFLISVHCSVTYPNAQRLQSVAMELPLHALVVETDSPYGAPQSRRGQRNEPSNVGEAVDKIAQLRGVDALTVANATTANARSLFALERAPAAGAARSVP